MELIEKQPLIDEIEEQFEGTSETWQEMATLITDIIKDMPTVDQGELFTALREKYENDLAKLKPKTGTWKHISRGDRGYSVSNYVCSECGKPCQCFRVTKYCSECGSKNTTSAEDEAFNPDCGWR